MIAISNFQFLKGSNNTLIFSLLLSLSFFLLIQHPLLAQYKAPVLNDINNTSLGASSLPTQLSPIGAILYFTADDGVKGDEPHTNTGGTSTALLKDIRVGLSGSSAQFYVNFSGTTYFFANTPPWGLWKTDGTTVGTVLVKSLGTVPSGLIKLGANMFFSANNGANGVELWISDGTAGNTNMLKDIRVGAGSSNPSEFTIVGSKLFFTANDGTGLELWVTDGTPAGTIKLTTGFSFTTASLSPGRLIEKDGFCYIAGSNGLYRSDGTVGGISLIKTLNFAGGDSWVNAGGLLYFAGTDSNGNQLWKSDGTNGGTNIVKMIAGGAGAFPQKLSVIGGTVYFSADDTGDGVTNRELWSSDGTVSGTNLVRDINSSGGSNPELITDVNGFVYFAASGEDCGVQKGQEIWVYDPSKTASSNCTSPNPKLYYDINPSGSSINVSNADAIVQFGTRLAFTADDGTNGDELWVADPCPNVAISYQASTLCQGSGNVLPTITNGATGATFSSTTGVVFVDTGNNLNSLTGEINLAACALGSYTITYELPGGSGGCEIKATYDINITAGSVSNVRTTETYLSSGFNFDATATGGPGGATLSPDGATLYITDQLNSKIQSVNFSTGVVSNANFITGLNNPTGVAVDPAGNIYVVERGAAINDGQIKKFNSAGVLQTTYTNANLTITGETFPAKPYDVAVDFNGVIYFTDQNNHKVKKIDPASTSAVLLAGNGTAGNTDGTGSSAQFNNPIGICITLDGTTLYVAEKFGYKIRSVTTAGGTVSTVAGSTQGYLNGASLSARFSNPYDVTVDPSGNVYVADRGNQAIRKVLSGQVTTDAGPNTASSGYTDGFGSSVRFNGPSGVYSDLSGNVFVIDGGNNKVRRVYSDNSAGKINGSRGVCKQANPAITLTLTTMAGGAIAPANIVKWQSSADYGTSWQDIASTNGAQSYLIPANSATLTQTTLYRAIVFSSGCSAPSNFATIVVYNLSPPVAGPIPSSVCSASTTPVTLTATGGTAGNYRWYRDVSGTPTLIPGQTNASYTFTPSTVSPALTTPNTRFYVGLTSATCSGSVSALTTIDLPVLLTPPNPTATGQACQNNTVLLAASGATGSMKYVWYDDAAATTLLYTSTDATNNGFVTPVLSATRNYYLRIDNGGCLSALVTVVATIYPNPTPVISGSNNVCENSTAIAYSTPAAAGNTFNWVITGGTVATGQGTNAITVNWGAAGAGQVDLTQTSAAPGSCPVTVSLPVTITPLPPPVADPAPALVCSASTSPVTLSATGGTAGNYRWYRDVSGTPTLIAGQTNASYTFTPNSVVPALTSPVTTFYVALTSATCPSLESSRVQIDVPVTTTPPNPTPIGGQACQNNTVLLAASGATGAMQYLWYDDAAATILLYTSTDASNNGFVTPALSATRNYYVRINNGGCQSGIVTVVATIYPNPTPVISGNNNVCENSTAIAYSTPAAAGNTFNWVITGGSVASGQGTNAITVNWGAAGTGQVDLTQTSAAPGSCPVSVSFPVTIFALVPPVADPAPVFICTASATPVTLSATGGTAGNYRWYRDVSGTPTLIAGQTNASYTFTPNAVVPALTTPVTTFYVALTSATCPAVSTLTRIDIPVFTTPSNPTASGKGCGTSTVILTASGATGAMQYLWYDDAGGTNLLKTSTDASDNTFTTPSISSTTNYYVRISNGGCLSGLVTVPATIYPNPTPTISGNASVCQNATGIVYSTPNVGGNTYLWTISGGSITAGQNTNSITVTWSTPGTGSVSVTETTSAPGSCPITTPAYTVTINALPTPSISGVTTACIGSSQTYSSPNVAGDSYSWSVTNGTITAGAGTNSITVTWSGPTPGTVSLTESITASPTCQTSTNLTPITLKPTPSPVITGLLATCINTTQTYSTPLVAGNTYTWTVTGGTITAGAGTNSITVNWTSAGNQTINVNENNGTCNTDATPITVSVEAIPAPAITGFNNVCQNSTGIVYNTPSSPNTFLWTVSGGVIVSGQGTNSITVNWGAGSSGSVQVKETTPSTTCQTTTPLYNVSLQTPPTPVVTSSIGPSGSNFCQRNSYVFQTTAVTGHSYTWNVAGGSIIAGQGTNQITVLWGNGGAGIVNVIESITSTNCQVQSTDYIANLLVSPNPKASGTTLVCENSTGLVYQTTNNSPNTYSWSVIGGTITAGSTTTSVTVNWSAAGQGKIIVKETNASNCSIYDTLVVTINPLPGSATVKNGLRCSPGQVKLYAKYPAAIGYNWYDASMTLLSNQTDTLFLTPTINSGVQTFYVEAITLPSCVGPKTAVTATISATNIPATVTANIKNPCGTSNTGAIDITVSNGQAPYTYTWTDATGAVIANTEDISNLFPGTYTVSIIDDGACTTVQTFKVIRDFTQVANVNAGPDQSMLRGETISLSASGQDAVSFKWTTIPARSISGFSDPNSASPTVSLDTTSLLIVEVTNSLGCTGYDTLLVDVSDFFIPNTFSPNNDGKNETFQVFGNNIRDLELKIFDRLGSMVFESKDKDQILQTGWDGTSKGTPMPSGNYVWQIKGTFNNGNDIKYRGKNTGNVILIR